MFYFYWVIKKKLNFFFLSFQCTLGEKDSFPSYCKKCMKMSMFLWPSLGIHDPEFQWQNTCRFTMGTLGVVRLSWNDFSRHWVRVAGSLWNLTNSHSFLLTCHCSLVWVFLGSGADILVILASENDWNAFLLCICLACPLCSIWGCHQGRTLSLSEDGTLSWPFGRSGPCCEDSLSAACQKSLAGCQQLCCGSSPWMVHSNTLSFYFGSFSASF